MLIVANRFYPQIGGAEITTYHQANELSKHFDVDVVTPIRDRDARRERVGDVNITRASNVLNPTGAYPFLLGKTFCPRVVERVLLGHYDLIHCYPALNYNNVAALHLAGLRKTPIFLTNFDLFDFAALLDQGMDVSDFGRLKLTDRSRKRLARFNAIFAISNRETNLIKAENPNTFLSRVPIVLDEYTGEADTAGLRSRLGIAPEKKVVLCLSRVSHLKGQDILLKALPALRARIDNFVCVIAGTTEFEPDYAAGLENFVAKNNLNDHVLFTGSLPRADVIAALRMCDVHVLPMRFMNAGSINTETWMSGRPIIQSTRVDPCHVEDGINGFSFDIDDESMLVDRLVEVLSDDAMARTMGENGKKLAEEKFHYPALIAQYLDIYRQCGGIEP